VLVNKEVSAHRNQRIVTGKCGLEILHSDVILLHDEQNHSIFRWRSSIKLARCNGNESMIGCIKSK
jgi:hypothetical protein